MQDELDEYLGKTVIVDTQTNYIYLGTLKDINPSFLVMEDLEVHDNRESGTSKELYIMETAKFGIRSNRRRAHVVKDKVVSISLLEDVIRF